MCHSCLLFRTLLVMDLDDDRWYYLIHLGYDIVRCPGKQETASEHLRILRRHADDWSRITTGHQVESVPWLIGCYYDYTEEERIAWGYPRSFGYTPTLLGDITTSFDQWERVDTRV